MKGEHYLLVLVIRYLNPLKNQTNSMEIKNQISHCKIRVMWLLINFKKNLINLVNVEIIRQIRKLIIIKKMKKCFIEDLHHL